MVKNNFVLAGISEWNVRHYVPNTLFVVIWLLITEGICFQHPVSCNAEYNYNVSFGEPKEYYFICRLRGVYKKQPDERAGFEYDIRHDIWDERFTKKDCKTLGCDPIVWKDSPANDTLLRLTWTDPEKYAVTAPRLKLCIILDGDQPKSLSLEQFVNSTDDLCTGMKDYADIEVTPGELLFCVLLISVYLILACCAL